MLLSWMFISSYTTIYFFFVKKFIFSNVYISVNTVFECLYMFFAWEKAINQVCTQLVEDGEVTQNACSCVQGKGVSLLMCRYGLPLSPFIFWHDFCVIVSCFICRYLTLPLLKKDVFGRNEFELVSRGFELTLLNFSSCF